jgi:hypothetical protein
VYIKTFDAEDRVTGAERIDDPVYVRWQVSNGMLVRCEPEAAQAILSSDGETIYLLGGQMPQGEKAPWAEIITEAEYNGIVASVPDPEDETPETPEQEETPLTRAELTARVHDLEEQNTMLVECLLEISEIVYG